MYKRISLFFIVIAVSIAALSGCGVSVKNTAEHAENTESATKNSEESEKSESRREDTIEIYNSENEKILETQDQKILDYMSYLIGMSTERMDEKNHKDFFKEVPEDAKVRYHYVFITRRDNKEVSKVDFYVYENYPYMTLKGIPLISQFTWELSKEDLEQLQNIERELSRE